MRYSVVNFKQSTYICIRAEKSLCPLNINEDDIFGINKNLSSNKSHGWDNFSVKIMKLCGKSIAYPIKLIFEDSLYSSLQDGVFPACINIANVVPAHKKHIEKLHTDNPFCDFGKICEKNNI